MNKSEESQYGFTVGNKRSKELFELIPIYPETTTKKILAAKMHTSGRVLIEILASMPANAPVIDDFGIISRIK